MEHKYKGPSALEIENATMQSTHRGRKQTEMYGGPGSSQDGRGGSTLKLKATDAQMRDYERNKPVNTPAGRARYADKAPKINIRKAYQE